MNTKRIKKKLDKKWMKLEKQREDISLMHEIGELDTLLLESIIKNKEYSSSLYNHVGRDIKSLIVLDKNLERISMDFTYICVVEDGRLYFETADSTITYNEEYNYYYEVYNNNNFNGTIMDFSYFADVEVQR